MNTLNIVLMAVFVGVLSFIGGYFFRLRYERAQVDLVMENILSMINDHNGVTVSKVSDDTDWTRKFFENG